MIMPNNQQNELIINPQAEVINKDNFELTHKKLGETTDKEAIIALFSLLEALSYEVMSGDLWWLATAHGKQIAVEKYGITEEVYEQVMEKFDAARKKARVQNPMHSMF
jgi:hypothetical protein